MTHIIERPIDNQNESTTNFKRLLVWLSMQSGHFWLLTSEVCSSNRVTLQNFIQDMYLPLLAVEKTKI